MRADRAAPRLRSAPARSSASSSVRANRSSSQASKSTPLRAPVMRGEDGCGARSSSPCASPCAQIVERQEVAARVRRPRTRPRRASGRAAAAPRRSTPQSTKRAARGSRALPPNQRCRCRNGSSSSRSISVRTLPSSSVSHAAPTRSAGRLRRPRRRFRAPSRAAIGGGGLLQPEPVERVRRRASGSTAARRCAGTRSGRASRPASCPSNARQVELDRLHACATGWRRTRIVSSLVAAHVGEDLAVRRRRRTRASRGRRR